MYDDVKKSLQSILYERASSPFYGTFAISWVLWNWKFFVVLFFVSEERLTVNKVDFITNEIFDIYQGLFFPLATTLVVITLFPLFTNKLYKLDLEYRNKRKKALQESEDRQVLDIAESIELRMNHRKLQDRFASSMKDSKDKIEKLERELTSYKEKSNSLGSDLKIVRKNLEDKSSQLGSQIEKSKKLFDEIEEKNRRIHKLIDERDEYKMKVISKFRHSFVFALKYLDKDYHDQAIELFANTALNELERQKLLHDFVLVKNRQRVDSLSYAGLYEDLGLVEIFNKFSSKGTEKDYLEITDLGYRVQKKILDSQKGKTEIEHL